MIDEVYKKLSAGERRSLTVSFNRGSSRVVTCDKFFIAVNSDLKNSTKYKIKQQRGKWSAGVLTDG